MLQQLHTLACQTWLTASSNAKGSLNAQWEMLLVNTDICKAQITKEERNKHGEPPYCIKSWLPSFEQVFTVHE